MLFLLPFLITMSSCTIAGTPTQTAIANAQQQNAPFSVNIDSIFLKLPSQSEIEQIILGSDGLALSKLIQTIEVKRQEIPCDALAVYSDQLIGMIKVVLQNKILTHYQLQKTIGSAEGEIEIIEEQIARFNQERKDLNLSILQKNLTKGVRQLEDFYDALKEENKKIASIEEKIFSFREETKIIETSIDEDQNLLRQKRGENAEYDSIIRTLEQKLVETRDRKKIALAEISAAEKRITNSEKQKTQIVKKISDMETQLSSTKKRADSFKKQSIRLEVQIERVRNHFSIAAEKDQQISQQLTLLEDQLGVEKVKLSYHEEQKLQFMIKLLQNSLSRFIQQNNEIYYNCFGKGKIQLVKTGAVIVYLIEGYALKAYLESAYQSSVPLLNSQNRNIEFWVVNPFGNQWTKAYGQLFRQEQLIDSKAFIQGDFKCLSPSKVQGGSGIIESIEKNQMKIRNYENKLLEINIGACSRMEASTKIPKAGQKIYFKGIFVREGLVDLYSATCF